MMTQNLEQVWFDRDLAWLEFNRRVLAEALDERTPLLERIKFLAIFTSNLDEFFMKRIAVLRVEKDKPSHAKLLADLRAVTVGMVQQQKACFATLLPELEPHGIRILSWKDLTKRQRLAATTFFQQNVLAALTPLVVDSAHPTPFLSNLSLSWVCRLQEPGSHTPLYGRVKVATGLTPWIKVREESPADSHWFISLAEIVRQHLGDLFPGLETHDHTLFRITRDAEVDWEGNSSESVREVVAERIRLRRYEPAVRIEFGPDPDPTLRERLLSLLELTEEEAYDLPGPFDFNTLWTIAGLHLPDLRDPPWTPRVPAAFRNENVPLVNPIKRGDLLVHVPYESFDASVERFIREGATDPNTLGIKMTVYRVGDDTPFVKSLVMAAETGKQVACVIELKARFDENRNLHWADALLKVGAHVSFGVLELKIHAKIALVVRQESDGLRCYCHIGTGNYNQKTARLYEDFGLFTCDPEITGDVVQLFQYLTGRARTPKFNRLLVAPWNMRDRFIALIQREVEHHKAGRPARIVAKMNQLQDEQVCEALVAASREGLPIDLVIRGFCCLRPRVPGQTETITIRSIIGRFLEHSRIFYFANGASDPCNGDFYIGSGDWMERNLSWRVEVVTPVLAPALRQRLWEVLDINLRDRRQAWIMTASGEYQHLEPGSEASGPAVDGTHATLMHLTAIRVSEGNNSVVGESPVSLVHGSSLGHPESNASLADTILENKQP